MHHGADFLILSRAIDALDRLYDGDSTAVDVEAILRLAGLALSDETLGQELVSAADRLAEAIRSAQPGTLAIEGALSITDVVRSPIAEAWSDLYS